MTEVSGQFFTHVVVPVANEDDAAATAAALRHYVEAGDATVTVLHVIEKAGGALDKASVEQRELDAEAIFERVTGELAGADVDLETELRYGTDVAATIVETATEVDASAIVFAPRGGSRWAKLLSGDVANALVEASTVPVLVLPDGELDESGG